MKWIIIFRYVYVFLNTWRYMRKYIVALWMHIMALWSRCVTFNSVIRWPLSCSFRLICNLFGTFSAKTEACNAFWSVCLRHSSEEVVVSVFVCSPLHSVRGVRQRPVTIVHTTPYNQCVTSHNTNIQSDPMYSEKLPY